MIVIRAMLVIDTVGNMSDKNLNFNVMSKKLSSLIRLIRKAAVRVEAKAAA